VQWVAFGSEGVIRQNNREEQRKIIRYNHLVANLVVFHNVVSMTRVLQDLINEGYPVTPEVMRGYLPTRRRISIDWAVRVTLRSLPQPMTEDLRLPPSLAMG